MNVLRIRDQEYFLKEVLLRVGYGRHYDLLTFNLFADSDEQPQASFAINCMSVPGITSIDHVRFKLDANNMDSLNELAESVICDPGGVLELTSLHLTFGRVRDGVVQIVLDAI